MRPLLSPCTTHTGVAACSERVHLIYFIYLSYLLYLIYLCSTYSTYYTYYTYYTYDTYYTCYTYTYYTCRDAAPNSGLSSTAPSRARSAPSAP